MESKVSIFIAVDFVVEQEEKYFEGGKKSFRVKGENHERIL